MKTIPRPLSFFIAVTLLATLAPAQTRGSGAAHAAASAAERSNAVANAQHAAAASSKAANAAAGAAGLHASAAHRPAATGATSNALAATTAAGARIPTTKGTVNAGISNSTTPPGHQLTSAPRSNGVKVHGTAKAPGLSADGNPGANVSASLNSKATAAHIRNATKDSRAQVFADVDSSVESSKRLLAQLRQQAHDLKKEAREEFKSAAEEARLREKALRHSLQVARKATDPESAAAQSRLAANYEGYAAAVARTESLVHGSLSTSVGVPKQ